MDELFEIKQELIDINDDEEIKQELMEDVKMEEETDFFFAPPPPPPSDELLDLQQKVMKLEDDFQGACRIAQEAQLRVKFLEDLLENRPQSSNNPERKLAEMQKKLSEATMKLDESVRKKKKKKKTKKAQMAQENAVLKSEIAELKKKIGPSMFDIDQEQDPEVKFRLKFNALTRQLNEKVQKAEEDRTKDRARIDELSRKLARYESGHRRAPPYSANTTSSDPAPEHAPLAVIVQIPPHPTNIFEPSPRNSRGSIFYNVAFNALRKKYHLENLEWKEQFVQAVYKDNLECNMCKVQVRGAFVLSHFFSKKHFEKLRECNAAVSEAAFSYWMGKLEPIQKPIEAQAALLMPAAAASTAVAYPAGPTDREHSMEEESPLMIKEEEWDEFEEGAPVFSPAEDEAFSI